MKPNPMAEVTITVVNEIGEERKRCQMEYDSTIYFANQLKDNKTATVCVYFGLSMIFVLS